MNGKKREASLLRFENSPDGSETRLLEWKEKRLKKGMDEMKRV